MGRGRRSSQHLKVSPIDVERVHRERGQPDKRRRMEEAPELVRRWKLGATWLAQWLWKESDLTLVDGKVSVLEPLLAIGRDRVGRPQGNASNGCAGEERRSCTRESVGGFEPGPVDESAPEARLGWAMPEEVGLDHVGQPVLANPALAMLP